MTAVFPRLIHTLAYPQVGLGGRVHQAVAMARVRSVVVVLQQLVHLTVAPLQCDEVPPVCVRVRFRVRAKVRERRALFPPDVTRSCGASVATCVAP